MAAPEGKQEKSSNQTAQQAGQTTRRAAQTAADVSGRAAAIGIEVVKRSNETAKHFWEASAQMATQLTHQATDQFGRIFGSGDDAQKAMEDSSRNLGAVLESTHAITSAAEEFSRQWIETGRKIAEATISRSETLAGCRTPQDLFAMQAELARENLNTALHGTRRLSEISGRAAQEAANKISERIRQVA